MIDPPHSRGAPRLGLANAAPGASIHAVSLLTDLHRAAATIVAKLPDMAPQRASEADGPLRDERTELFEPLGHPIAHRMSAKQRQIQAMAGGCQDLTSEFP